MKSTERLLTRLRNELALDLPADTVVRSIRRQGKNCVYSWKWFLYSPNGHIHVLNYGGAHTVAETLRFRALRAVQYGTDDWYVEPVKED